MPICKETMELLPAIHTWTIRYDKRSANVIIAALTKSDFPRVNTFNASPPPPIHKQYREEQNDAAKYTRTIYYHVGSFSDISRTPILIYDDSKSSKGHLQIGNIPLATRGSRILWWLGIGFSRMNAGMFWSLLLVFLLSALLFWIWALACSVIHSRGIRRQVLEYFTLWP